MRAATGVALRQRIAERLDAVAGGAARRRVIVTLAAMLALDSADKGTVGAAGTQLQHGLGIGKTELGLLLSITTLVGAVATLPAGVLVDRYNRTRLLSWAVVLWGVAMAASVLAPDFTFLVVTRVFLGVVTGLAGPSAASLIGDYFPASERGRVYGLVLSGELIGSGFGFVVSGDLAKLSWRASFAVLILPAAGVVWLLHRLPEPARGGASRLPLGAPAIHSATALARGDVEPYSVDGESDTEPDPVMREVRRQGIEPRPELVLDGPAQDMNLIQAVRYVLRVRTNLVLIAASALGYFFVAGVHGFGVEFVKHQYGLPQSAATLLVPALGAGALVGLVTGGRLADRLLRRGRLTSRIEIAGAAVLLTALLFLPALLTKSILVALPMFILAALALGAVNPPTDAARLDIMPPALWGRAEAARTLVRNLAEAAAPLLFGATAQHAFGGGEGLRNAFLIALAPLLAAGLVVLIVGRRTYPRDVATAGASSRAAARSRRNAPARGPATATTTKR